MTDALNSGYRFIDTSPNYDNEEHAGKGIHHALNDGTIKWEDLFVLTKIEREDMSVDGVEKSLDENLERLQLDYIDLLIIHAPATEDSVNIDTWKGLDAVRNSKKVKSIGVSNFSTDELRSLMDKATVRPVINQVRFSPGNVDWETKDCCDSQSILTMAYSPLKKGKLDSDVIQKLAEKYEKAPQQIALRWTIEVGTISIPRSGNPDHIKENIDIFDFSLTDEEVQDIKNLS